MPQGPPRQVRENPPPGGPEGVLQGAGAGVRLRGREEAGWHPRRSPRTPRIIKQQLFPPIPSSHPLIIELPNPIDYISLHFKLS